MKLHVYIKPALLLLVALALLAVCVVKARADRESVLVTSVSAPTPAQQHQVIKDTSSHVI